MAPLLDTNGIVDAWLTVPEAVALGVASRATIYRHLDRRPDKQQRDRGGQVEYRIDDLPIAVQQAYLQELARTNIAVARQEQERDKRLASQLSSAQVAARLGRFDNDARDLFLAEAVRRHGILRAFAALRPKHIGGVLTAEARALLDSWRCTDHVILQRRPSWGAPGSQQSFYRLLAEVEENGVVALIPEAPRAKRADDGRLRLLAPDVVLEMKRVVAAYPHATTQSRHRKLVERFGSEAPSLSSFKRWMNRELPNSVRTLLRDGTRKFEAKAAAYIHRDRTSLDVGEWICGDQHELDFMAINPDRGGALERPWLTAFVDERSRAPVGWYIGFAHNTETIIAAFLHAVGPKAEPELAPFCGLPHVVYVDNGHDYVSKKFEFLLEQNRIEHRNALPYNAKAKSVERFFKTVCQQFSQDQLTWFGNRPDQRPGRYVELEKQHERWLRNEVATTPFMTIDQVRAQWSSWVIAYVQRKHDGLAELATGRERSPLEVAADRRAAPIIPRHETLLLQVMDRFERTVDRGNVRVNGYPYCNEELLKHHGRKVWCRRSPSDVRKLLVTDESDRNVICWATAAELVRMTSEPLGAEFLKELKKKKRANKKIRDAYYDLVDAKLSGSAEEIAPPPATPAAPSWTGVDVPAEASIAMTSADRLVRQARAAIAAAPSSPSADVIDFVPPPPAPSPSSDELDELYAGDVLGPRPELPKYFMSEREVERAREAQEDWDRMRLEIIAERRNKRAAKAM